VLKSWFGEVNSTAKLLNRLTIETKDEDAMQIILQEDVEKLARERVVEVAAGYARNYLLPHKFALEASPATSNAWRKSASRSPSARQPKRRCEQQAACSITSPSSSRGRPVKRTVVWIGHFHGSRRCARAQGFQIDKRRIALDEPIKIVGESMVTVKLVHGVTAQFKVVVEKEG